MRWLNSLVIFLGLLIVGGIILLGYGFYKKAHTPDWQLWQLFNGTLPPQRDSGHPAPKTHSQSASSTPLAVFGQINLNLPHECTVKALDSYDKRIYITIGPAGICHKIIIFDPENGRIQGTIKITK